MGVLEILNKWNEDLDPRTKDLPLVASNYQVPLILIVYLYVVLKWGPNYMKDKKPYDMKTFIRCYNVVQIFVNGFIVIRFVQLGFLDEPMKFCIVPDYSFNPIPLQVANLMYLGWLSRLVDFTETVTFVLRKKDRQISFLHVYHHVSVIFVAWYYIKFYAVHMAAIPLFVNSAVHVVMYIYYFFSSYGDKASKILREVKPFITIIQLVQFVFLILQTSAGYLPSCDVPSIKPLVIGNIHIMIYFVLFYNFYRSNYKTQQKQKK